MSVHGSWRRAAIAATALVLASAGLTVAVRAFLRNPEPRTLPTTEPTDVRGRVSAEIDAGRFPQEIAFGHGAVWVTVNDPEAPEAWYVARIDPTTDVITDEIAVFEAGDIAVGPHAVWVTGRDRELGPAVFRIDPGHPGVEATVPLGCGRCYADQIAASVDALWLTVSTNYPEHGEIVRIDAATNAISGRVTVPGDPRDLTIGDQAVWVYALTHFDKHAVSGGSLYQIDPSDLRVAATLLAGDIP